jgi:hypothetical protein
LSNNAFEAGDILKQLCNQCGDIEFGYRMQALFAHILMKKEWNIVEVNAQGHPDIRAERGGESLLVQVKSVGHRSPNSLITLSKDDVDGIAALGNRGGWFAALDQASPVQWIIVTRDTASRLLGRPLHLSTLLANSDAIVSDECNRSFYDLILLHRNRLPQLTYGILRRRALSQDEL